MENSTLPVRPDTRRHSQLWPVATIRETTRFDVVDQSGEMLAERLPLSVARDFRDRWNSCRPDRQAAVRVSTAERPDRQPAPTEAEIAVLAAEIRRGWSAKEERRRRGWSVKPWRVPGIVENHAR